MVLLLLKYLPFSIHIFNFEELLLKIYLELDRLLFEYLIVKNNIYFTSDSKPTIAFFLRSKKRAIWHQIYYEIIINTRQLVPPENGINQSIRI